MNKEPVAASLDWSRHVGRQFRMLGYEMVVTSHPPSDGASFIFLGSHEHNRCLLNGEVELGIGFVWRVP